MRRTISSAALLLAACSFGFTSGGFPASIHTVSVSAFENNTSDAALGQDVTLAVKQGMISRLGLRSAADAQADAQVTGKVTRYDPDQALDYQSTPGAATNSGQITVTKRQVTLTVDITVKDQKTGRLLYDGKSVVVQGAYDPGRETDGRRIALDNLVKKIIDEVHRNW